MDDITAYAMTRMGIGVSNGIEEDAQEMMDLWAVWNWIQERGGSLGQGDMVLVHGKTTFSFYANYPRAAELRAAAEWIRQQEEER